jgi:hypothetical protein
MSDSPTKVEDYLTSAIAGSLVGQVASHRRISFGTLLGPHLDGESPELRALSDELTELGIDPAVIANHSLLALVALFAQSDNADLIISQYTSLLWTILGDPKSGSPPEIYRRAGCAMHLALLGILDPSFVDHATKQ